MYWLTIFQKFLNELFAYNQQSSIKDFSSIDTSFKKGLWQFVVTTCKILIKENVIFIEIGNPF